MFWIDTLVLLRRTIAANVLTTTNHIQVENTNNDTQTTHYQIYTNQIPIENIPNNDTIVLTLVATTILGVLTPFYIMYKLHIWYRRGMWVFFYIQSFKSCRLIKQINIILWIQWLCLLYYKTKTQSSNHYHSLICILISEWN